MAFEDLSDENLTFLYWYQDVYLKGLDQSEHVMDYGCKSILNDRDRAGSELAVTLYTSRF